MEGVQARLRADKAVWTVGETPGFKIDLRSNREKDLSYAPNSAFGLELDGVRYRVHVGARGMDQSVPTGGERRDIPITIDNRWHRWDRDKGSYARPALTPGEHTVRFTFRGRGMGASAVTGTVEIVIDNAAPRAK